MTKTPLSPENFEKLLLFLDPADRERAGETYDFLWSKAREYFSARACTCAEELADEVMSRLAKKNAEGEVIMDVLRYCYGLAHWIWKEFLRTPDFKSVPFEELPIVSFVPADTLLQKERSSCYLHCMSQLSDEEREMIVEYFDGQGQTLHKVREKQARRMGISVVALRIRITRIRRRLDDCYSNCRENGLPKTK